MNFSVKRTLKRHVIGPLARLGVPRWTHHLFLRRRLAVLMYHAVVRRPPSLPDWCFVAEEAFREQMRYLHDHFDVVPLSAAAGLLAGGPADDAASGPGVERPAAIITFDDGYQNNHDVAFPVLRELGLPATVFLNTAFVGTADTVWFCRLNEAIGRTRLASLTWRGIPYDFSDIPARVAAASALQGRLKGLIQDELLTEVRSIVADLGSDPDAPLPEDSPYRMMGTADVAAMDRSGLIDFGGHTHTHAILTRLLPDRRREEIRVSLATVKALTGKTCLSFAYPNGSTQDYGTEDVAILRELGVKVAVTTVEAPNVPGTPLLELRRYGVGEDTGPEEFAWLVHHLARPF